MPEILTLYTSRVCPSGQRVEITLIEANAQFDRYEIDLGNKPGWYTPKVNPAGKVPAVAYGGPKVPADQPSPSSTKIAESLVLLEFVADLYPDANIFPRDPVLRAKARFFIDAVSNKYIPAAYIAYVINGEEGAREKMFKATEDIQALLPSEGYAIGEWSIADAAITPFLARLVVSLENDIGRYPEGEGPATLNDLRQSQKFTRFNKYLQDVTSRQSFTKTFDKEYNKQALAHALTRTAKTA